MDGQLARAAVARYPDLQSLADIPYQPRGIFNSEMALVIAMCRDHRIDMVIESGRARGHSTLLLARYLPAVAIHSFERRRDDDALHAEAALAHLPNVHLRYGDAGEVMPDFVKQYDGGRIAILIDGPKAHKALALMADCLRASEHVVLGFIHDMGSGERGKTDHRVAAEKSFDSTFFTDDPVYVDATRHLDRTVFGLSGAGWSAPHTFNGKTLASYGPTIACFEFTPGDRLRHRNGSVMRRLKYAIRRTALRPLGLLR
jgi:hypothetical protein